MAGNGMPLPPLPQLGESFASQYYERLSSDANKMNCFYTENSFMILAIDGKPPELATGIDQIQKLISTLDFVTIQTKSIHCPEAVNNFLPTPNLPSKEENPNGVHLVVSGFAKIKFKYIHDPEFCNFVHTMYLLAPHGKGYFITNDFLHITTHHHHVPHELKPAAPLTSKDIDPRFHSEHPPPVTDNGNLDESAAKRFQRLMCLKVSSVANAQIPDGSNLFESFASQYYGLLCSSEANNMDHFYSEHSTMIHVINGVHAETATGIDQIQELISRHSVTIETKSIHSLDCVENFLPTPNLPSKEEIPNGMLLVVSGFVKIKDIAECRKFVHTLYLAPQGKDGYFIMNDILHIMTHDHQVPHELKPVATITSKNIDPQFRSEHPPPVTDNGNLDESAVKRFQRSMSLKVHDVQKKPIVSEIPTTQEEASSSNSLSVANADDTTPENMAVREEPPQIPDGANAEAEAIIQGGRGSGGKVRGARRRKTIVIETHGLPKLMP